VRRSVSASDEVVLRRLSAEQIDEGYVQFTKRDPDPTMIARSVRAEDYDEFVAFYRALAANGDRWRYPVGESVLQLLVFRRIEVVGDDVVSIETCELSNAEHYLQHDPFSSWDDETVSKGIESTVRSQRWVRVAGEWKATIDIDQQVFRGENRCEN
jgi:hypothetical protein